MAASTITRDTWTNDTGTPSVPVNDGTLLANTVLQNHIYARIDQMFAGAGAYATFTVGGKLSAEGFGSHSFSAGGTGTNRLFVRNTTAGTGNLADLVVGNNADAGLGFFQAFSSTYTTSGSAVANGVRLGTNGAGGLQIDANSGAVNVYTGTGGTGTLRATFPASGSPVMQLFGVTHATLHIQPGSTGYNPNVALGDRSTYGWEIGRDNNVGGVSGFADALYFYNYSGTPGVRTTFYSTGEALFVAPLFGYNGTRSAPSYSFGSDHDTGIYRSGANMMGLAAGGGDVAFVGLYDTFSTHSLELNHGTFGTGATTGCRLAIGENQSGAPGYIEMHDKNGAAWCLWVDSTGKLRINASTPPYENTGDTGGTVVGTQL